MKREFWNSAGAHLLEVNAQGWLGVTPQFVRAYLTRPEIHPVEESCAAERDLHARLMDDPAIAVTPEQLVSIADPDAADNYRVVLAFRDRLLAAGTVEGAYLDIVRRPDPKLPPVFLDQLVHVILRNILEGCGDPMRLRAGEIFFREQLVSTDGSRLLLADEEIVDMHAHSGEQHGLMQLLSETGVPAKSVTLDVLGEDNADIYWQRSDRFDTVVDFRFEQPAPDAFARVIEAFLRHLLGVDVRVEPRPRIDDPDWRWHIGLDREATSILNALYRGEAPSVDDISRLIGLFRMRFADDRMLIERVRGKPVHLGLAMTPHKRVRMKPQNLIVNLPLAGHV